MFEIFFLPLFFTAVSLFIFSMLFLWQDWLDKRPAKGPAISPVIIDPVLSAARFFKDTRLSRRPKIDNVLRKFPWLYRIQDLIAQSGTRLYVDEFLALTFIAGVLGYAAGFSAGLPAVLCLAIAVILASLPYGVVVMKKTRRLRLIETQLPDLLDSLARSMQAGNSFAGALSFVSKDAPDPIAREFRLVAEEINFGSSTKEGLLALTTRVDSLDLRYFVLAVLIQSQTGGNLAQLLLSLSALIRERIRLKKLRRVLSAEGRLSAWILCLLPPAIGLVMYMLNPGFISLLWTNPAGLAMLKTVSVLMVIGIAWMWRIVHFRI